MLAALFIKFGFLVIINTIWNLVYDEYIGKSLGVIKKDETADEFTERLNDNFMQALVWNTLFGFVFFALIGLFVVAYF